jgi:dienelactone hydrolase
VTISSIRCGVAFAIVLFSSGAQVGGTELELVRPGSHPVATTNLEVTPHESGPMFEFLNGKVSSADTKYLTDILVHPEAVPILHVDVPRNPELFGAQAGTRLPVVLLIVYPTTPDNPRTDYKYPYKETGDALLPHMEQPGDKPVFADAAVKYPLVVYSGGYNTHGLWHLYNLKALAAHGYIVVDMFHGDGRGRSFTGNLALRSLQLRATLDYLLQHSDFAPAIDATRIGVSGASAGGHTVAAALGGIDPSGIIPSGFDPRIKAGVGLVPFLGGSMGIWPFKMDAWLFGKDHAGLREVQRPFLAIYGEKDSNVPPEGVEAGVRAMRGSTVAVRLNGESHGLSDAANTDSRAWELLFFDAWLKDDASARKKLESAESVRGGANDQKTYQSAR